MRAMMPFSNNSSIISYASFSRCFGICLAIWILVGVASLARVIFIGGPFISISSNVSWTTLVNSLQSLSFISEKGPRGGDLAISSCS